MVRYNIYGLYLHSSNHLSETYDILYVCNKIFNHLEIIIKSKKKVYTTTIYNFGDVICLSRAEMTFDPKTNLHYCLYMQVAQGMFR